MIETDIHPAANNAVENFCKALARACREHQMYPEHHTLRETGFQQLVAATEHALDLAAPIRLVLSETDIRFADQIVYSGPLERGNLAFVMFRDGLRELLIYPGVEREELQQLVECIASAEAPESVDQDLVTMLWESDLAHIDYVVADPLEIGAEVSTEVVQKLRDTVLNRLDRALTAVRSFSVTESQILKGEDPFACVSHFMLSETNEEETKVLFEANNDPCPLEDLHPYLLDLLNFSLDAATIQVVLRLAIDAIVLKLKTEDIDSVLQIGNALAAIVRDSPEVGEAIGRWDLPLSSMEQTLRQMLAGESSRSCLDQAPGAADPMPSPSKTEILLKHDLLYRLLLPSLLHLLMEEPDRYLRRIILRLLMDRGHIPLDLLSPYLADSRWYVVRNAVQLLPQTQEPVAEELLRGIISHPEARVRREAARVLEGLAQQGQNVEPLLPMLLRDVDSVVRTVGCRLVPQAGNERLLSVLLARVTRPDFARSSSTEIEATFAAIKRLARTGVGARRAIQTLDRLWRPRLFRSPPIHVRAAAISTIGEIPGEDAASALRAAMRARDVQIRNLAAQALVRRGLKPVT